MSIRQRPNLFDENTEVFSRIRCYQCTTAVCWDKDSTLANTQQRHWMIPHILEGRLDWQDYAEACLKDEPVVAARTLMSLLANDHLQVVTTGAFASAKTEAARWLRDNEFAADMMMMRPQDTEISNGLLKANMVRRLRDEGIRVVLFIEDNPVAATEIETLTDVPVLVLNPMLSEESLRLRATTSGSI